MILILLCFLDLAENIQKKQPSAPVGKNVPQEIPAHKSTPKVIPVNKSATHESPVHKPVPTVNGLSEEDKWREVKAFELIYLC